jgi:hypothetical protein
LGYDDKHVSYFIGQYRVDLSVLYKLKIYKKSLYDERSFDNLIELDVLELKSQRFYILSAGYGNTGIVPQYGFICIYG